MYFYEVAPASRQYHGSTLLTYSSTETLPAGQIIVVKIRNKSVLAFVMHEVTQPDFKCSPVVSVLPMSLPATHSDLFKWIQEYYPAPVGLIAQLFLPFNSEKDYLPVPLSKAALKRLAAAKEVNSEVSLKVNEVAASISPPPLLNAGQQAAVKTTLDPANSTVLLHGDTGSGKTRVYIELAQKTLAAGKSVLVLVPEIALSPQIVETFTTYIDAPIRITHSGLTTLQRRKAWQAIMGSDQPQVVIGPRSALFTPLSNIGLIVVDEFHEPAYKQDGAPYYQTVRVASQFARLHGAQLVLGSATPPVGEYYVAEQKKIPIIRMTEKAAAGLTEEGSRLNTKLVNLKDDAEKTKYPLISNTLLSSIAGALSRGEQTLLFLNKRGSARVILCQNCGWHALCPRCDLPLTYHGDHHKLQCHTCGYQTKAPSVCPECSSHDILFRSPGTKAVVDSIAHRFPEARIARFDKDNLKAERLETRHSEIMSGEIDILIGTQLLAKGHDLPRLGLVGILLAENELQFPDYTSSERSYQLMHQLIGRVGRGHRAGEIVVQTYDPANLAVQTAIRKQTWEDFYQAQIAERQAYEFPPFYYIMKIEVSRSRLATVESTCNQIIDFLRASGEPIKIGDPVPSFLEKRNDIYNWQIIVKAKQRTALTRLAASIPIKCTINLDPSNLL